VDSRRPHGGRFPHGPDPIQRSQLISTARAWISARWDSPPPSFARCSTPSARP
jgi:hypothetical protein